MTWFITASWRVIAASIEQQSEQRLGFTARRAAILAAMVCVLTLTIVIGAYFLAEGVVTIMYALEHRRELSGRWSWMLMAGLMDILISFLIISGLPGSAEWAIGLLVGINLVLGGASLVGMALAARES